MPRRFFKNLSRQRHYLRTRWYMRPFEFVFGDAAYWSINRRSVTRAVALGLFVAFLPPPIPHTLAALAGAIALRVNIPVTFAASFITNPFTMLPVFYSAYWFGCWLLHLVPVTVETVQASAGNWQQAFSGPFIKPFLLGCALLGLAAAVLGYVLLGLSWHLSLVYKLYKRKRLRRQKESSPNP